MCAWIGLTDEEDATPAPVGEGGGCLLFPRWVIYKIEAVVVTMG
jgi:hypothetical protein